MTSAMRGTRETQNNNAIDHHQVLESTGCVSHLQGLWGTLREDAAHERDREPRVEDLAGQLGAVLEERLHEARRAHQVQDHTRDRGVIYNIYQLLHRGPVDFKVCTGMSQQLFRFCLDLWIFPSAPRNRVVEKGGEGGAAHAGELPTPVCICLYLRPPRTPKESDKLLQTHGNEGPGCILLRRSWVPANF